MTMNDSNVRPKSFARRRCWLRAADCCALRRAVMSGADGAESIGGVYIGVAAGLAAGSVGSSGAAPAAGSKGAVDAETVGLAVGNEGAIDGAWVCGTALGAGAVCAAGAGAAGAGAVGP